MWMKNIMPAKSFIIEPHFLPVSAIFAIAAKAETIILDDTSIFQKQSFRNRAIISGPNKCLALIVPVKKGKTKLSFRDVIIDDSFNWQKLHWESIISSYNNSPFFEFYADSLYPLFQTKYHFLLDLNVFSIEILLKLFQIKVKLQILSEHKNNHQDVDLRNYFHPKTRYSKKIEFYNEVPYNQVFKERFGFIKDLSAIDLLFNAGNQSKYYLEKAIIKDFFQEIPQGY